MKLYHHQAEIRLPKPLHEVFPFFSEAYNLEELTPPWVKFQILTPRPITMEVGTLIDYRIRVRGIPLRWRTRIDVWEPPHRFVDTQLRGPYRRWVHEHVFEADGDETICRDNIEYAVWGGPWVQRFWVGPDVTRIFKYRQRRMLQLFGVKS
jgi:ligand-binding SRPBCC domain-containing protein